MIPGRNVVRIKHGVISASKNNQKSDAPKFNRVLDFILKENDPTLINHLYHAFTQTVNDEMLVHNQSRKVINGEDVVIEINRRRNKND